MADKKISQLTSLAQGDIATTTDVLAIVDTSATETKKATPAAIVGAAAAAGLTNVDINSGTIDGATIATSDITVGTGKTLNVSAGTLTLADNQISGDKVEGGTINAITINTLTSTAVNATTVDATNVEVTNIKAKDGTAAGSIADSTGVVTLASTVLTTTDINGGTIDGTAIGASSTSTGAFSTLSASGNLTLSGGTANGVLYLNGSKVATSGSALSFTGSLLKVGNPTNAPNTNLSGNLLQVKSSSGFSYLTMGNGDGADNNTYIGSASSITTFGTVTDAGSTSELMRLTSTGLGIGTSSPAYKLDVAESGAPTSTNTFSVARISGSDSVANDLTLLGPNTSQVRIKFGDPESATIGEVGYNHSTNSLRFVTNGAEAGVFDSSGNLGIGTSSPTYKLHLVGKQIIEKSGAGYEAAMLSFATITETGAIYRMGMASGGAFIIGRSDTSTTNLTLDSSGNLGLGVTPSAWATYKAFEFAAGGALWGSANNTVLNANTYFNGTNFIYKATGTASYYQQATGEHRFFTAASGTAGDAISFTQAMRLSGDSDISLLLGTTSAAYATSGRGVFEVNGSSSALIAIKSGDTARGYFAAGSTATELAAVGASQPLLFTTNSGERGRFTSGGYFKASSDGTYLTVGGNYHELRGTAADWTCVSTNTSATTPYGHYIRYISVDPNGTGSQFIQCLGTTTVRAEIRSNGGLANYQSNNVDLSDARTKKDIAPAASMWDKIGALEIVTYKYNDQTHDDVNVGVIAQQVESVEPVWVDADGFGETPEGEEPLKTVYTKDITFAAIKALQEAMARIEKLEAEVSALKGA